MIREKIIQGVSWFRHRDAIASSVIGTVYHFFLHYGKEERCKVGSEEFQSIVDNILEKYRKSINDDKYEQDKHYHIFIDSASGNELKVAHAIKTMDYVSSMTDNKLMEIHDIALRLFR